MAGAELDAHAPVLVLVKGADGSRLWLKLVTIRKILLWREAIANTDLPAFARRYQKEIAHIFSADVRNETITAPRARLSGALLIALLLAPAGLISAGTAVLKSTATP